MRGFHSIAVSFAFVAGLAATALLPNPTSAQPLELVDEQPDRWRFVLTPYLFLPFSTSGTSTVAGQSAALDMNLSEVLDILQGAASIRGEAWRNDFGLIADLYYVKIGLDESAPIGPAGGGEAKFSTNTEQTYLNLMGSWRFMKGTWGNEGRRFALDVSGGLRWNQLTQEIDVSASFPIGPGGGRSLDLGGTESWWEPVFGLRGAWEVADRWTLGIRADLSGFGVNGDDLQYLVLAGADWRAWEKTSIKLGYQFYGIDYSTERSDGKFAYDVDQNGPYLGLSFRF